MECDSSGGGGLNLFWSGIFDHDNFGNEKFSKI